MKKKSTSAKKVKLQPISERINEAPEGILILAFSLFAFSILTLSFTIWLLAAIDFANSDPSFQQAGTNAVEVFTTTAIGAILFTGLFYVLGRGLLRYDNRSRIVLMVLVAVILVSAIVNVFNGVLFYANTFLILLFGTVLWYLLRKDTTKLFK